MRNEFGLQDTSFNSNRVFSHPAGAWELVNLPKWWERPYYWWQTKVRKRKLERWFKYDYLIPDGTLIRIGFLYWGNPRTVAQLEKAMKETKNDHP